MNIKNKIKENIVKALKIANFEHDDQIHIEHPKDLKNGNFTTNIAMILAGKTGQNPREIAQQILDNFAKNNYIKEIKVAGPGYLNFWLSNSFLKSRLETKLETKKTTGGKILFEHSSPNLFKPFHIGHVVNNSIGESLSRILRFSGNQVVNISFPSDVSPGIAKTIWALKKQDINIDTLSLQEIADAYVLGSREYKEDNSIKVEIDKINIDLYNQKEGEDLDFYNKGKKLSLNHFKEITKKLGSNFEDMIYESDAEVIGKDIVQKNIDIVFKKSDGAIIFEGKNFTNVFINSQGFGTYLAKDIGLLKIKKDRWSDFDKSFVITDVEQKQHFEMVKESGIKISEISDFVEKSNYLQHGRMNFSGKIKISSRYGNVPLATDIIKMVQENILEKMQDRDFSEIDKIDISEKLAIATLKYSILKVTSGKNISFDLEKDTNTQGDTGTFLMYSLVRAKSIFKKIGHIDTNQTWEVQELDLLKYMDRFDEVIERVMEDNSPHHLANFLFTLAKSFNSFYEEHNILNSDNLVFYTILINKYISIMEKGFELLSIETVEKM